MQVILVSDRHSCAVQDIATLRQTFTAGIAKSKSEAIPNSLTDELISNFSIIANRSLIVRALSNSLIYCPFLGLSDSSRTPHIAENFGVSNVS
jgi:hypothetical protein